MLVYCHPDGQTVLEKKLYLKSITSRTRGKGHKNVFLLEKILDVLLSKALERKKTATPQ